MTLPDSRGFSVTSRLDRSPRPVAEGEQRAALVGMSDPLDVASSSGTVFYMRAAIESAGFAVSTICPLSGSLGRVASKSAALSRRATRHRWLAELEPSAARHFARQIDAALDRDPVDILFSSGVVPVSRLGGSVPLVVWADATLPSMLDYYPDFTGVGARSVRAGTQAEAETLGRAQLCIFSSAWAADSAVSSYNLPTERVRVIPYGANFGADPGPGAGNSSDARLLLVGTDWRRKGAEVAIEAVSELREMGVETSLDIVGPKPPRSLPALPTYVRLHGFASKGTAEGAKLLDDLYRRASVFVLPTSAECFGVVFCEAAAYGLPVVTTATGGVSSAVEDGRTGVLLPTSASGVDYARAVLSLLSDESRYAGMRALARDRFEKVLNWQSAGVALATALSDVIL